MRKGAKIWLNGRVTSFQNASIPLMTHGLHYGGAVFEGVRVYHSKPFKLIQHLNRFKKSAELIKYSIPFTIQALERAAYHLIERENIQDGYLRPLAWRGHGDIELYAPENTIDVALLFWEWPSVFGKEREEKGITLQISNYKRPSRRFVPFESKASGNYLLSSIAKFEACEKGYDDALLLDDRDYIAEASAANIFFVRGKTLHTPIADAFLNGITRQTVFELAYVNGLNVIEGRYSIEDLKSFDEVFLTGTAYEILPVRSVESHQYQIGPVTKWIQTAYKAETRCKTHRDHHTTFKVG